MKNILQLAALLVLALGFGTAALAQTSNKTANGSPSSDALPVHDRAAGNVPARVGGDPAGDEFVIGTGDVLAINVWKEAEVSRVVPVRPDGRISLPLIGELQAGGRTAKQLEAEIRTKLKDYVSEPEVTVIVQEIKSQKFNVLGMVTHPGSYALVKPMTVVDAIAMAGGFRDFAKQKNIYVLHRDADGKQIRLPFNYKEVIQGRNSEQNVELQSNDTVVVP
jgi:polysaccharide export outer membrane protein